MSQTRWAFYLPDWKPTLEHLQLVSRCVQPEEKIRLGKFCFQRDAKASLVGRLLMRKYCCEVAGYKYDEIKLKRDENNKPVLDGPSEVYFNVSHQGDFVVLAGSKTVNVGVDVMKIEARNDTQEFFRLMTRQLTKNEWANIRSYDSDYTQLRAFIRHWCLKEAYVKAVGTGIVFDLQRIDFNVKSELGVEAAMDTDLKVDGKQLTDWVFEEFILGNDHIAAVASNTTTPFGDQFQLLNYDDMMKSAIPFTQEDEKFSQDFLLKPYSPKSP